MYPIFVKLTALTRFSLLLWASAAAILVWSGYQPYDRFTWFLEVFPVLVGAVILVAISGRFTFTRLVWVLLWVHAVVLMVGGHYTYAKVPLFDWIRDALGAARNDYDRVGHFLQGFVPAMVAREVLIRRKVVSGRGWLFYLVVSICLAISAAYELVEWTAAVASGEKADAFLGTQGDPWDTQKDMALALAGSICAQIVLGGRHDRAITSLNNS